MTPRTKYSGKRPQRTMALLLAIVSMTFLPLAGCKQEVDSSPATAPSVAPVTYTVTFDANGGSGTMESQTFTPNQPKELTACTFTKEGHSFDGWSLTKDGSVAYLDKASYPATASTTLYAVWTAANTVQRVVASPAGGSSVDAGDTVTLTSATEGATIHWTVNGGTEQTGASSVSVSIPAAGTVVAWATKPGMTDSARSEFAYTLKTYTVTFTTNMGTTPEKLAGLTKGSALPDLPAPTFTGYTFGGWQHNDGSPAKKGDPVTGDLTLTATWLPITYTVTFDANGGSGTMESRTFTYDQDVKLPKNTFTGSTGLAFTGWNTAADGNGSSYADEQAVKNLASTQGATVPLYAQWSNSVATVTFSFNGTQENYSSFPAAIQAIATAGGGGGTITLMQDVTQTQQLSITNDVTIDFNGKTIQVGDGGMIIITTGNLQLTGSRGGGITGTTDSPPIQIHPDGTLAILSGTISSPVNTIQNNGTLVLQGGTVSTSSSTIHPCISNSKTAIISGGTVSGETTVAVDNTGTLTITGGTMTVTSGGRAAAVVNRDATGGSTPTLNLSGSPEITGNGTDASGFLLPGLMLHTPATITGPINRAITVGTKLDNLASGSWKAFSAGEGYTIVESDKNHLKPVLTEIPAGAMPTLPNGGTISTALEGGGVYVKVTPK